MPERRAQRRIVVGAQGTGGTVRVYRRNISAARGLIRFITP